jgi:hypothetical protein
VRNRFLAILAKVIVSDLLKKGYVIADNEEEFEKAVYDVLYEDYELEKELDEEAERILKENSEEVLYRGVPFHKARRLIKERLAKERGIPSVGSIFDKGRANYLSGRIVKLILSNPKLDYTQDTGVIRATIVKSFEEVENLRREIDQKVKEKIASHSRPIYEGTPEWFALYRKYYDEELVSRGIVDEGES